jgi:hypothetical protein
MENLNKSGVMPPKHHLMQQRYQMCAGFEVIQLHETTDKFKNNRTNGPLGEVATAHRVDIRERKCTCGKWQEYGCPCIDAMAYYWLFMGNSLEEIMLQTISPFYNYTSQHELFRENIDPVIVEMLENDNVTKPPNPHIKRQQGIDRRRNDYVCVANTLIQRSRKSNVVFVVMPVITRKHVRQEKLSSRTTATTKQSTDNGDRSVSGSEWQPRTNNNIENTTLTVGTMVIRQSIQSRQVFSKCL